MVTRLVGRTDELSALLAHCASATPGTLLLTGEAGVGKTRLLDELAGRLAASGATVLRGGAVPGGGPFRPLVQALVRAASPALADAPGLRPYAPALARLLPAWPQGPEQAGHLVDPVVVLGEAVRALLGVLAGDGRCVLALDDLHWADRDTLALVEYLAAGPPVPLVLAARWTSSPGRRTARRSAGSTTRRSPRWPRTGRARRSPTTSWRSCPTRAAVFRSWSPS